MIICIILLLSFIGFKIPIIITYRIYENRVKTAKNIFKDQDEILKKYLKHCKEFIFDTVILVALILLIELPFLLMSLIICTNTNDSDNTSLLFCGFNIFFDIFLNLFIFNRFHKLNTPQQVEKEIRERKKKNTEYRKNGLLEILTEILESEDIIFLQKEEQERLKKLQKILTTDNINITEEKIKQLELSLSIINKEISKRKEDQRKNEEQRQKEKRIEKRIEKIKKCLRNESDLIEYFYENAYSKITIVDNYGEEKWYLLEEEAKELIHRIARKKIYDDIVVYSEDYLLNCILDRTKIETYNDLIKYINEKKDRDDYILIVMIFEGFLEYYKNRKSKRRNNKNISNMTGIEFEEYLLDELVKMGYNVKRTPITGDQGADLIAEKDNKRIAIQAKRYKGSVGNSAVQEVIAAKPVYDCDECWVITNSCFTKSAEELAQIHNVKLIDGNKLKNLSSVL